MICVFCSDSTDPSRPEPDFLREVEAARRAGAEVLLIDHDALVRGEAGRATARVTPRAGLAVAAYRGWMVTPGQYAALYAALEGRGVRLINDPAAYRLCHHLPESYPAIAAWTPRTVWIPRADGFELPVVLERLRPFGDRPVILKDYVKSAKHAWREVCFIPSAADANEVARVVGSFLRWQGEELNEGLVFREFLPLAAVGTHPRSGMPLTEEYRLVILDGQILASFPYWDAASYAGRTPPPEEWVLTVARAVKSRFFSLDVARLESGGWIVIEVGDAQVTGIPAHADAATFVARLARTLDRST